MSYAKMLHSLFRKKLLLSNTIFLFGISVIYLFFCSRTYYWDGVSFALAIEAVNRGDAPFFTLLHPNHLFYNVFGYYIYRISQHLGFSQRAIVVLQYSNLTLSLCCGYLMSHLADHLFRKKIVTYCCWLLFSFGALWWHFSTDADAYILTSLLITISFFYISKINLRRLLLAGIFHVLAMLFHELAILFYLSITTAIFRWRDITLTKRLLLSVEYVVATATTVTFVYYFCYLKIIDGAPASFLTWVSSRADDAHFQFSLAKVIGSNLNSYIKLFLGGKLSFIRQYMSLSMAIALLIVLLALLYAFYSFQKRNQSDPTLENLIAEQSSSYRDCYFILVSWLLPYFLFLSVWLPWNGFYKLLVWPPLVLLLGFLINDRLKRDRTAYGVIALIVAMAGWNFAAYIYPHSHDTEDPVLVLGKTIDKELPNNAVIYYQQFVTNDWYLKYFAPGRIWKPLPKLEELPTINQLVQSSSTVCFETSALNAIKSRNKSEYNRFLTSVDSRHEWNLISTKYNVQLRCVGFSCPKK